MRGTHRLVSLFLTPSARVAEGPNAAARLIPGSIRLAVAVVTLLVVSSSFVLGSNTPIKSTKNPAVGTSVVIGTDGNGNYTIKIGPSTGALGNPTSISVQLPDPAKGNGFKTTNASNGTVTTQNGVSTFTFKTPLPGGNSNINPGKFQLVPTVPGTPITPLKGFSIIKVTYSGGTTASASDDSYEDPKAPPKKNRFSEADSTSHSLSFNAQTGLLTIDNDFITKTSIPNDPAVGAAVHVPTYTLLGITPDHTHIAFGAVANDIISVEGSNGTLLQASAPFLFYSLTENDFSTMLQQIGLTGAAPSSPFFDPALTAPTTPWITHLGNVLNPAGADFVADPPFGFSYTPDENFFTATDGLTLSGSFAGTNALFVTPEPSSLVLFLTGLCGGGALLKRSPVRRRRRVQARSAACFNVRRSGYLILGVVISCWTVSAMASVVETLAGLPVLYGQKPDRANTIYSTEFVKMLQNTLVSNGQPLYEDLEMVFSVCHGGGFVNAITNLGLPGNYSAVSAVPLAATSSYDFSPNAHGKGDKWPSPGLKGTYDAGNGKTEDMYTMSYGAEYIRGLMGDPKLTAQQLDQYAKANFKFNSKDPGSNGPAAYGGNGAAATINGYADTMSKHAILYYGGIVDPALQNDIGQMSNFLGTQKYDNVTTLFAGGAGTGKGWPTGFSTADWKNATQANLQAALTSLADQLKDHPGKEKALLYFDGHGAASEEVRTYVTRNGDPPLPGEGKTFTPTDNQLTLPLDPEFQRELQVGVAVGGHFLVKDPTLHRYTNPYLNLTTYAQHVSGPMGVYIDGLFAGNIDMKGTRGDYSIQLPDSVLSALPWSASSDITLDISFQFAAPTDSFQISTAYDYNGDPTFSAEFNGYGLGIEQTLQQGPQTPEPPTGIMLLSAAGTIAAVSWKKLRG